MAYSYSTAREVVNLALEACGVLPVSTDAQYSATGPTGPNKYQRQAIIGLDLLQRQFAVTFTRRIFWRKFQFQTTDYNVTGQTEYEIPNVIVEGFRANSFFNVTATGQGVGGLDVKTYQYWRDNLCPQSSIVSRGAPSFVVPLPDAGDGKAKILLWPYPDMAYTIEGQSRLIVPPITSGAQYVSFPKHYEHMLVFRLVEWIESKMNEGREMSAQRWSQQSIDEVMRDAMGADEEQDVIDMGVTLDGPTYDFYRDYYRA